MIKSRHLQEELSIYEPLFLVSPQEISVEMIEAKIKEHSGADYFKLERRPYPTWIIATSPHQITAEVATMLGMREEDSSKCNAGLVVEMALLNLKRKKTQYLATKEDIQKLKVWVLGGVIGGLIAAVPIALLTVKLFSDWPK